MFGIGLINVCCNTKIGNSEYKLVSSLPKYAGWNHC